MQLELVQGALGTGHATASNRGNLPSQSLSGPQLMVV